MNHQIAVTNNSDEMVIRCAPVCQIAAIKKTKQSEATIHADTRNQLLLKLGLSFGFVVNEFIVLAPDSAAAHPQAAHVAAKTPVATHHHWPTPPVDLD